MRGYAREMVPREVDGDWRRLRLRLRADPDAPAAARRALRALPLGEHADDVLLLASELVSNAVRHAGLEPGDAIELAATSDGLHARVEVRDHGPGFTPSGSRDGFGLHIVAGAASDWGVELDGATCVWFELP
jgi:anti-sigma regulatory factor (Ser/Thr protein kinase)